MTRSSHRSQTPKMAPDKIGFSFQEDLWFGDFDDDSAREAAASSMAAMAGRIMGARPFPAAAQRLVHLTRDDNTNIMKVVRVLESDPGLSQRVLRLVNSSGYGLRVRCTSLNHATALLGQQRLQQIATSAVLLNHFGKTSDETKRKQEHGALVASLCRYLAIHLGLPQEDLFTCGLLHDLGQLMMLDDGEKGYRDLVIEHEHSWDTLHIFEREILGFDHAVLAAHVLASWSIPAPVPEVIALHHQPALAHQRGPKISAMVQTLRFADQMSHLLESSDKKAGPSKLADSEAASYLGFSEMQISAMWQDLKQLHHANLSRRMDIADIAPRSVSVPPSLAPRKQSFTESLRPSDEPPVLWPPAAGLRQSPAVPSLTPEGPSLAEAYQAMHPTAIDEDAPKSDAPGSFSMSAGVSESPYSAPANDTGIVDEHDNDDERPSQVTAAPEIFPCATCYGPTFGARCVVCEAHVCSSHVSAASQWCLACEHELLRYQSAHGIPTMVKIAGIASLMVAVSSSLLLSGWNAAGGVFGIFVATAFSAYALHQGYLKSRFTVKRRAESTLDGEEDFAPSPYQQKKDEALKEDNKDTSPNSPLIAAQISYQTPRIESIPAAAHVPEFFEQPETIPAPSLQRRREQAPLSMSELLASEPPLANQYSWPPSQQAPLSSRLPSVSPQQDGAVLSGRPSAQLEAPPEENGPSSGDAFVNLVLEPAPQHIAMPPPASEPSKVETDSPAVDNDAENRQAHSSANDEASEPDDHSDPPVARESGFTSYESQIEAKASTEAGPPPSSSALEDDELTIYTTESAAPVQSPSDIFQPIRLAEQPPLCEAAIQTAVITPPKKVQKRVCSNVGAPLVAISTPQQSGSPQNENATQRASGDI